MQFAIEAEGLAKAYPPDTKALDGLSFAVPEGTVFGLLGPNGAGKTTAVKVLTTLTRPDAGAARVGGMTFSPSRSASAARSAWSARRPARRSSSAAART